MLGLLVTQLLFSLALSSKRVAIVGSGISGATAAYTLRAAHPTEELEIVVFEKEDRVGGRMTNIEIEGTVVEVGASVFHIVNEKLVNYSSHFGIETEKYKNKHLVEGNLGIWDGTIFRFWESTWPLLPKVQAVMRYGLSPLRLAREVDVMMPAFKGIYAVGLSFTHLLSTPPAADCISHTHILTASRDGGGLRNPWGDVLVAKPPLVHDHWRLLGHPLCSRSLMPQPPHPFTFLTHPF
jgi:hypothetical protein